MTFITERPPVPEADLAAIARRAVQRLDGTFDPADATRIARDQSEALQRITPLEVVRSAEVAWGRGNAEMRPSDRMDCPGGNLSQPPGREALLGVNARMNAMDPRVKFRIMPVEGPQGDEQSLLKPLFDRRKSTNPAASVGDPRVPTQETEHIRREILRRAYIEQSLTLDDLLPFRIIAAWRFVRDFGLFKGLISPDEPLVEALRPNPLCIDPWQVPAPVPNGQCPRADEHRRLPQLVTQALHVPEPLQYHRFDWEKYAWIPMPGIALLPPPVPPRWWNQDCDIRADYDIDQDTVLHLFCSIVNHVTQGLYIEQGSPENPDLGRYGLIGLLEPATIRMAFPTRIQIITWEEMLTEETLRLLIKTSQHQVRRILKNRYGLQPRECNTVIRLAIRLGQVQSTVDVEENRTVMVLRLEDYLRRAKEACDMRSEMHALKQMSIVQGLGNEDKQDIFAGMIDAVRNVANERREMLSDRKVVENIAQ